MMYVVGTPVTRKAFAGALRQPPSPAQTLKVLVQPRLFTCWRTLSSVSSMLNGTIATWSPQSKVRTDRFEQSLRSGLLGQQRTAAKVARPKERREDEGRRPSRNTENRRKQV